MAEDGLGHRLRVAWYRLNGMTPTQAEWRARQHATDKKAAGRAPEGRPVVRAENRFACVCGNMLVAGDRKCDACGRRQWVPYGVRRIMRVFGLVVPDVLPATSLVLLLMALGMLAQYRSGMMDEPTSEFEPWLEAYEMGASISAYTLGPQLWRAVTYAFLHGGVLHILMNTLALIQVAPLVERRYGAGRFLLVWVVGGAAAVLLPAAVGYGGMARPVVGASGALSALIGLAMVRGHLDGDARGRYVRDVMWRWMIYTAIFGFMVPGVANDAHLCGYLAGAALAVLVPPPDGVARRRRLTPLFGAAGLLLLGGALYLFGQWLADGRPMVPSRDPEIDGLMRYLHLLRNLQ